MKPFGQFSTFYSQDNKTVASVVIFDLKAWNRIKAGQEIMVGYEPDLTSWTIEKKRKKRNRMIGSITLIQPRRLPS